MDTSSRTISTDTSLSSICMPTPADVDDDNDYIPYGGVYSFIKDDTNEEDNEDQDTHEKGLEEASASPQLDLSFDKIPFSSTIPSTLLAHNGTLRNRWSICSFNVHHKSYTIQNITDIAAIVPELHNDFEELDEIMVLSPKSVSSHRGGGERDESSSFLPAHARFDTFPTPCPKSQSMPAIPSKGPFKFDTTNKNTPPPPRLLPKQIWRIAGQIINLVHSLHTKNIVHGALCPDTITQHLDDPGQLALGILNSVSEIDSNQPEKWAWFAPEIILGWTFDERVDVWGFGSLLFWLVFHQHPFGIDIKEDDELEVERLILHGPIQFPGECEDPDLKSLIRNCLERNPIARPSIQQVIDHEYFQNEELTFDAIPVLAMGDQPTSAQRIVHRYRDTLSISVEGDSFTPPNCSHPRAPSNTIESNAINVPPPEVVMAVNTTMAEDLDLDLDHPPSPLPSSGTPLSLVAALQIIPAERDQELTPEERISMFWDRVDAEARLDQEAHQGRRKLRKKRLLRPNTPSPTSSPIFQHSPNSRKVDKDKENARPDLPDGLHWSGSGGIGYDHPTNWCMPISLPVAVPVGCHPGTDIKARWKKIVQSVHRQSAKPSSCLHSCHAPNRPVPASPYSNAETKLSGRKGKEEPRIRRVEAWKTIELVRDRDPADSEAHASVVHGTSGNHIMDIRSSQNDITTPAMSLARSNGTNHMSSSTHGSPIDSLFEDGSPTGSVPLMMTPGTEYTFSNVSPSATKLAGL